VITIELAAGGGARPYLLERGALGRAGELLAAHTAGRRPFVVSDETVARLHAGELAERLGAPLLALPPGEEQKSLAGAEAIARWLLDRGVERGDVVIAVGGGVVTDLAGFAASITLRGLRWVAVPTTLLGMVDAAVGGKTGVDLDLGKNLLGTFWHPEAVLADPGTLETLDRRQLRSGLVEVVKAAMITPARLTAEVDRAAEAVAGGGLDAVEGLIAEAVRVKAAIVAADEREAGRRAALNLGHTVGHALEGATGYRRYLHGEAVAWGIAVALELAVRRGELAADDARRWLRRLRAVVTPPSVADLGWDALRSFVARDKKGTAGAVRWVLPHASGVAAGVVVTDGEAAAAWDRIGARAWHDVADALE